MNLILCGMMGSGKTTVGKALALLTGRRLVDTDALIVEKYGRIADIFAAHGEASFREIETETVRSLSKRDGLVIATGGGLVLKEENVTLLRSCGKLVYLRASVDTLENRLKADTERPLLKGEPLRDRLERLLGERSSAYENAADFVLDADGKTPEQIAEEIVEATGV